MYQLPSWAEQGVTDVLVTEETITEGKLPMLHPEPSPRAECEQPAGCAQPECLTCPAEGDEPAAATG